MLRRHLVCVSNSRSSAHIGRFDQVMIKFGLPRVPVDFVLAVAGHGHQQRRRRRPSRCASSVPLRSRPCRAGRYRAARPPGCIRGPPAALPDRRRRRALRAPASSAAPPSRATAPADLRRRECAAAARFVVSRSAGGAATRFGGASVSAGSETTNSAPRPKPSLVDPNAAAVQLGQARGRSSGQCPARLPPGAANDSPGQTSRTRSAASRGRCRCRCPCTRNTTSPPSRVAPNQISPPGSVYLAAFTSKFERICSKPIGIGLEQRSSSSRNVQVQRVAARSEQQVVRFGDASDDLSPRRRATSAVERDRW